MKTAILGHLSPFARVMFLLMLLLSGLIISLFISIFLAFLIFDVNIMQDFTLLTDLSDPKTILLLKLLQIAQSIVVFIAPALIAAFFFEKKAFRYLGLRTKPGGIAVITMILIMFVSIPFFNWMITLNESMQLPSFLEGMEQWMKETENEAAELTSAFLDVQSSGGFLINLLMIAVLPALGEEVLFRGLLQKLFSDWFKNIHVAIFLSAFIFGVIHMQFFGLVPRMMLGALFGYLFFWTGSLWLPILAHFINNGTVVILAYLYNTGVCSTDFGNFGTTSDPILITGSAIFTLFLIYAIFRKQKKNHPGEKTGIESDSGVHLR